MMFSSPDTLIPDPYNPLDWNRYQYARANPLRFSDPTGHFTEDEIIEYFGVENWEEVLKIFEKGGVLEGRWGWLTVLQKAEIGDDITINWDVSQLPNDHGDTDPVFHGRFDHDIYGNLIISGAVSYIDQIKAAKYGNNFTLQHYTSDPAKQAAAAFLIGATDIVIGIPAFVLMFSGEPPIMIAAELLETFVVLPVNVIGIKMWRDAEHSKLESVLNVSAIPDNQNNQPNPEVK
jgi:hypothetical protein